MLGSTITRLRESAGFTVPQVAEALGVSRTTVYAWEGRAGIRRPEADHLRALMDLLSVPADERPQVWNELADASAHRRHPDDPEGASA